MFAGGKLRYLFYITPRNKPYRVIINLVGNAFIVNNKYWFFKGIFLIPKLKKLENEIINNQKKYAKGNS